MSSTSERTTPKIYIYISRWLSGLSKRKKERWVSKHRFELLLLSPRTIINKNSIDIFDSRIRGTHFGRKEAERKIEKFSIENLRSILRTIEESLSLSLSEKRSKREGEKKEREEEREKERATERSKVRKRVECDHQRSDRGEREVEGIERERERRKKATNGAHEYTHDTTHGRYKHTSRGKRWGSIHRNDSRWRWRRE